MDTTASESKGVAFWRGTTYHGDAGSVLILFCDDTHQSRSQQQENEGIFKLKKNKPNCKMKLNMGLLKLSWTQTSSERISHEVLLQGPSLLVTAASHRQDAAVQHLWSG